MYRDIKPELKPFSSAKEAMDEGLGNLEVAMIYLDIVLAEDKYHNAIMEILEYARDTEKDLALERIVFNKPKKHVNIIKKQIEGKD